jgi:hypothetical protein
VWLKVLIRQALQAKQTDYCWAVYDWSRQNENILKKSCIFFDKNEKILLKNDVAKK